jgi:hypothetical protein
LALRSTPAEILPGISADNKTFLSQPAHVRLQAATANGVQALTAMVDVMLYVTTKLPDHDKR